MVYVWVLIQFSSRFQYFEIYWDLVYSPVYGLSWWTQHIHLERIYNLQLLGVVFYIYKLGQSGWWCCSDLLCLDWYFQPCSIYQLPREGLVSNYVWVFIYFFFYFFSFCFGYFKVLLWSPYIYNIYSFLVY